jgi:hypothetical protein
VTHLWPINRRQDLTEAAAGPDFDRRLTAAWGDLEKSWRDRMARHQKKAAPPAHVGPVEILVYANSHNQLTSLRGTLDAIGSKRSWKLFINRTGPFRTDGFEPVVLDEIRQHVLDEAMSFARRHSLQLRDLARREAPAHPGAVLEVVYHLFTSVALLERGQPALVLLANDHLTHQRCLIAAAHLMNVRTAYLQHAAVSPIFPRLDVDFAFLDGMASLETYALCMRNAAETSVIGRTPRVFLTGQKRPITVTAAPAQETGVAINTLDRLEGVEDILRVLHGAGCSIHLRWHPRQSQEDIRRLRDLISATMPDVAISDPALEDAEVFLGQVGTVIAADSSILMEAAIAGCRTVYIRTSDALVFDYYGFVASGLAIAAADAASLPAALRSAEVQAADPRRAEAVRHFSETFGTRWFGREGDLVARAIDQILEGAEIEDLERVPGMPGFPEVYRPRS